MRLEHFDWTSRRALCERLVRLLGASRPPDLRARDEAPEGNARYDRLALAELVALTADETCTTLLTRVLVWPAEDIGVRNLMAYALAAVGADVPLDDLKSLLRDRDLSPGPLLCLCRTEGAREFARQALLYRVRSDAAAGFGSPSGVLQVWYPAEGPREHPVRLRVPEELQALEDELCDEYMAAYAPQALDQPRGFDVHLQVACARFGEPEARALLLDRWKQAANRETRQHLIWICPHPSILADWLSSAPPPIAETLSLVGHFACEHPEAAARIVADQYGLDEVLLCIEEQLRAGSRGDRDACMNAFAAEWFLRQEPGDPTTERLISFLSCPDIYHRLKGHLRRAFRERLWAFSPEQAVSALNEVLSRPDADPDFIKDGIVKAALDPRPEKRGLFFRILAESETGRLDRGFRFLAVHALEQIGEDSPEWRGRLAALSNDEDPCLRLLATAALIRRGAAERLGEIVELARQTAHPWDDSEDHSQGLAVRLLGELAPEAHSDLFQSLILVENDKRHNPSPPQEAAYALACLASPAAVVTLVRAYPLAEKYLARAIHNYLPAAISRLEGRDTPMVNRIPLWRYSRFPP